MLEGLDERVREAMQPIAVGDDGVAFDLVENFANFGRRTLTMIQECYEVGDSAFKINIVFPKGVVGVDEQRMTRTGMNG